MKEIESVFQALAGEITWEQAAARLARGWEPHAVVWPQGDRATESRTHQVALAGVDVGSGDHRWTDLHGRFWPAYRKWYLQRGPGVRPTLSEARRALEEHMPELTPTWRRLVELADGDEDTARMLTMWNSPPFISGCSQAALAGSEPALVRNYDYDLDLFEGVVLASRFGKRATLGTSDQLWGLLDGVNDAGIAVSLAFGGRRVVGQGFGIPIVLRYVLETCSTLEDVRRALARIPVQTSYNVLAVDAEGTALTAYLNPDRPTAFRHLSATTNHQDGVEWPHHNRLTRSVERERRLRSLLAEGNVGREGLIRAFLSPPLRSTRFSEGFGTIYTAAYDPAKGSVRYCWSDTSWEQSIQEFRPSTVHVTVHEPEDTP